jgi:hypothetical protein
MSHAVHHPSNDLNFFTEHYMGFSLLAELAMTAIILLPLAIPREFKVFLLIVAAVIFAWMNRKGKDELPICGADINADGIARPPQERYPERSIDAPI